MNTPRTTLRYEADKYDQGAFSAYENMRDLAMELERELAEAIESRKFQLKLNVELNEREKQTHAELAAVTEQRDEALSDLEFRRDLFVLQEQQLNDVRAERDRLAEAIRKHKAAFPFAPDFCDVELYEALQSLTTKRNSDGIRRHSNPSEGNDFMIPETAETPLKADCPSATCSACRFWRQDGRDKRIGVCVDAVERARNVVPFAINLQASFVFGHGGKDCPCFEPNQHHKLPSR